jgi:hypothetical protein
MCVTVWPFGEQAVAHAASSRRGLRVPAPVRRARIRHRMARIRHRLARIRHRLAARLQFRNETLVVSQRLAPKLQSRG